MHRIPKIFVINRKRGTGSGGGGTGRRSGGGGGVDSMLTNRAGSAKRTPRLERRNASNNIDYELPSTSSFSSEDSSSSGAAGATTGAQRSRSLDIYPLDKQTSFRIEGKEGEFELICASLGFSGIEDFCIPTNEWEAMKVRSSSDVLPRIGNIGSTVCSSVIKLKTGVDDHEFAVKDISAACSKVIDKAINTENEVFDFEVTDSSIPSSRVSDVIERKIELNHSRFSGATTTPATARSSDVTREKIEVTGFGSLHSVNDVTGDDDVCWLSGRLGDSVRVSDVFSSTSEPTELPDIRVNGVVFNENEGGVKVIGCNGIKGVRPPSLAPPPAMSLPVIDSACSTWDILKAFAPQDNGILSRFEVCEADSSEDEGRRNRDEEEENEAHPVLTSRRIGGESGLLSESCSFTTTSNDDDSSSTTTEHISPNGRFSVIIKPWQKGGLLGRGSFGSVYEGIASNGFFFALKEVSLLDQGDEGRQSIYQLEQEIALLSQFEHDNIVQYYGTDKDESKLYIFLELVTQGSLMSLYQKYRFQDSQVSNYTRQILHGLKYLHDRDVVHRDIKCANILVDASGSVKLADFGLAKAAKLNDVKSCKGTAFWMAPEVVNRRNQGYGRAADIWSLGCTVLEMLTRQFPYSNLETMQALFRIGRGVPPEVPESLSRDARDFILQCLQVNPSSRPSAAQLLDHPFVKRSLSPSGSASPYHPAARRF